LLFYKVDFFNTKGKKILQTSSKYYCVDPSIKNAQNEFNIEDRGRILENIVLIELLRRNYEVTVGKLRHREIDFVASKGKDRIYIQVASRLDTNEIKKREYGNLQSIRDSYKKIVITEERVNFVDDNGIETVNIVN
jgi:predicted AAA+ superfamily ATPase